MCHSLGAGSQGIPKSGGGTGSLRKSLQQIISTTITTSKKKLEKIWRMCYTEGYNTMAATKPKPSPVPDCIDSTPKLTEEKCSFLSLLSCVLHCTWCWVLNQNFWDKEEQKWNKKHHYPSSHHWHQTVIKEEINSKEGKNSAMTQTLGLSESLKWLINVLQAFVVRWIARMNRW